MLPSSGYAMLIAGFLCAGIGGELFVRGVVGLARWLRVAPGIVGATVAAFATSSPELAVSLSAAVEGAPQIALGDALGSNVVNAALVLALALLVAQMPSPQAGLRRDAAVALLAPAAIALLLVDGLLSRSDGLVLWMLFSAWLAATMVEAARQRRAATATPAAGTRWRVLLSCLCGLALLGAAGHLVVGGARTVAAALGVAEFVVGATLVAVGTSIPELATTVVAQIRGHAEIGLGTVLGSNIFNGLFVVGAAALIHPIAIAWHTVAVTLAFGVAALLVAWPTRTAYAGRGRGVMLLALYGAYLVATLLIGAD